MTDPAGPSASSESAPEPVSLYVHVPFCVSKCAYCDFYSRAGGEALRKPFVDAALFEAGHWSHYDLLDDVPSLYVGGGTPTLLGDDLVRLVRGLIETARLRPDAEITIETNPETTNAALVTALMEAGANRFSLGVQSFDDDVLRTLGRCHDAERAREATRVLRDSGAGFSIDLICGVPGQTIASWEATLDEAVRCGARHLSVYPLTVEEGTPLDASVRAGEVPAPESDDAADMMLAAEVVLTAAGMPRYEVASYAQPGHEARHNLVYWTGGSYLGVGPHAASMLTAEQYRRVADAEGWALPPAAGPPCARVRFTRESTLEDYVRRPLADPGPVEYLDADEAAREDAMLGLRTAVGISAAQAEAAGAVEALVRLAEEGLVRLVESANGEVRWSTTEQGWLLGNRVFEAVWIRDTASRS
jgi:oxygen-independent coproporphyrinogen-3 oxidase